MRRIQGIFLAAWVCLLLVLPVHGQDLLEQFEQNVTTFTLDNGLTFVVVERREAPVVSFHTYADVGGVDEQVGQTGLAHMFEHMAFKGTTSIGTTDVYAEVEALERAESIYQELRAERLKGPRADQERISELEEAFESTYGEAREFVLQNEFDRILQQEGMTGLNATTGSDATRYFYSLPANKAELFFATESDRFLNPVMREFYEERDVVMEERRLRTDSNPVGRLVEEFVAAAFKAHPYGSPVIGHMSDLESISITEAEAFFEKYYNASNLTIAIVGDVETAEMQRLAEKYFGRLPAGEPPSPVVTREPEQRGERRVTLIDRAQPYLFLGFHRPSMLHEDHVVYTVLADVLSRGRTSRFHRNLVETELALGADVVASFPGSKYPHLFFVLGVPSQGVSPADLEEAILAELEHIKEEGITEEELERARTRARADLINQLGSNAGLAGQMASYQALTGDWRTLFNRLDAIDAVTIDDVQRVAQATFTQRNRTVATMKPEDDPPTETADED